MSRLLNDDELLQLRNFIAKKYGIDTVLAASNTDNKKFLREYKKFIAKDKEIQDKFNITMDNRDFEISISENILDKPSTRSKNCAVCGKEWMVMSNRDQYYALKHECCENCFFTTKQVKSNS